MGKKFLALLVVVCQFAVCAGISYASSGDVGIGVTVDGEYIGDVGVLRSSDGELLVPLRAVSNALGADEVIWDPVDDSATVRAEGLTLYVPFRRTWMEANGRCTYVPGGLGLRSGVSYVPVRALAWAFGADYTYEPDTMNVRITAAGESPEPGDSFYGGEDLYWMARIIEAEAGIEPFAGKIAVGNVVMNRVAEEEFPDSVRDVIFDRRFGIQFSPAYSGSVYNTPSFDSIIAAKLALEGTRVVGDSLYFAASYVADTCWAGLNRPVTGEIGGHVFFG